MKILVIGGDSRIAKLIIPRLGNHDVQKTTRRKDTEGIYLELNDQKDEFFGMYDCVIVCACDFKKGRPEEEQFEVWETNVTGIKNILSRLVSDHIIFLSSYLADKDISYGRQKKEIEEWLKTRPTCHSVVRIDKLETDEQYEKTAEGICELVR